MSSDLPQQQQTDVFQFEAGDMGKKGVYATQRYKDIMDALWKPVSSYTLLYESPSLVPKSKTPRKKKVITSESKEISPFKISSKKIDLFPHSVTSLTSTGMLDEARVFYRSASGETELPGIIKGSKYLCGCKSCNFSKGLSADEFEKHAVSKPTSHANDRIHLGNSKSLNKIVKELKSTPLSMKCAAIQTVLGASINQQVFQQWKESFEAEAASIKFASESIEAEAASIKL